MNDNSSGEWSSGSSRDDLKGLGFDFPTDDWPEQMREAASPLGRLGPYELVEEIARGGQGVIYKAKQPGSTRHIAVKRLLAGSLATPAMRRRFDREFDAASALRHPNIVTVYSLDFAVGQPLLAMEWIDGEPISLWAANGHRGARNSREIVQMICTVCDAVRHAHQHGVVHRDLKPSNILVDGEGQPHILDFGLAKRLDDSGVAGGALTLDDQFVGTPAYASPEQLHEAPSSIDARTDVYSLGVILYEMLTGRLPYSASGSPAAWMRAVERGDPIRPSALNVRIDRELELVVLKAMAKDREERYQSVDAFGEDLRRYLRGEPILAHPPSGFYQLRKLVRRHRLLFVSLTGAFAAALGVAIGASLLAARLEGERAKVAKASEERGLALVASEQSRRTAEATSKFFREMLASITPDVAKGRDVSLLREMVDRAAAEIESRLAGQPEVLAEVRSTIGRVYDQLGEYEQAEVQLRAALQFYGQTPCGETAGAMDSLGVLLQHRGNYDEPESLFRSALAMRRALFGDVHETVAQSFNNLGVLYLEKGDFARAADFLEDAVRLRRRTLGSDSLAIAQSLHNLALAKNQQGDYEKSETLFGEAMAIHRAQPDYRTTDYAGVLSQLGNLLHDKGRYAEAESLLVESLTIIGDLLGPDHPSTALTRISLGSLLTTMGRLPEAETLLRQAAGALRRGLGPDHLHLAAAMNNLGLVHLRKGELSAAKQALREAAEIRRKQSPGGSPDTVSTLVCTAQLLLREGNREEAETVYTEALEMARRCLGNAHPTVAMILSDLGNCARRRGDYRTCERLLHESLAIARNAYGESHPLYGQYLGNLGVVLLEKGAYGDAEARFREALAVRRAALPKNDPSIAWISANLADALLRQGYPVDAEISAREALALLENIEGAGQPTVMRAKKSLAEALIALGEHEAAEPLLLESFCYLMETSGVEDQATQSVLRRLVEVYDVLGMSENAETYRQSLDNASMIGWLAR